MEKLVLPELLFTFLSLNLYIFDFVLVRLYGFSLKTDAKIMILSLSDKYLSVFFGIFYIYYIDFVKYCLQNKPKYIDYSFNILFLCLAQNPSAP